MFFPPLKPLNENFHLSRDMGKTTLHRDNDNLSSCRPDSFCVERNPISILGHRELCLLSVEMGRIVMA